MKEIDPTTGKPYQIQAYVRRTPGVDASAPDIVLYQGTIAKGPGVGSTIVGTLFEDPVTKAPTGRRFTRPVTSTPTRCSRSVRRVRRRLPPSRSVRVRRSSAALPRACTSVTEFRLNSSSEGSSDRWTALRRRLERQSALRRVLVNDCRSSREQLRRTWTRRSCRLSMGRHRDQSTRTPRMEN